MTKDPRKYLWDAAQAAEQIAIFTAGRSFADYLADDMLRAAVERKLAVIGEALGRLSRIGAEPNLCKNDLPRAVGSGRFVLFLFFLIVER